MTVSGWNLLFLLLHWGWILVIIFSLPNQFLTEFPFYRFRYGILSINLYSQMMHFFTINENSFPSPISEMCVLVTKLGLGNQNPINTQEHQFLLWIKKFFKMRKLSNGIKYVFLISNFPNPSLQKRGNIDESRGFEFSLSPSLFQREGSGVSFPM